MEQCLTECTRLEPFITDDNRKGFSEAHDIVATYMDRVTEDMSELIACGASPVALLEVALQGFPDMPTAQLKGYILHMVLELATRETIETMTEETE